MVDVVDADNYEEGITDLRSAIAARRASGNDDPIDFAVAGYDNQFRMSIRPSDLYITQVGGRDIGDEHYPTLPPGQQPSWANIEGPSMDASTNAVRSAALNGTLDLNTATNPDLARLTVGIAEALRFQSVESGVSDALRYNQMFPVPPETFTNWASATQSGSTDVVVPWLEPTTRQPPAAWSQAHGGVAAPPPPPPPGAASSGNVHVMGGSTGWGHGNPW